jgi:hypothetical protein
VSTTDGPTDIGTKFHFTPDPREHIHSHSSDDSVILRQKSARDPNFKLSLCTMYLMYLQKKKSVSSQDSVWPNNHPSSAGQSIRKSFIQSSSYDGIKRSWCTILLENEAVRFAD